MRRKNEKKKDEKRKKNRKEKMTYFANIFFKFSINLSVAS